MGKKDDQFKLTQKKKKYNYFTIHSYSTIQTNTMYTNATVLNMNCSPIKTHFYKQKSTGKALAYVSHMPK